MVALLITGIRKDGRSFFLQRIEASDVDEARDKVEEWINDEGPAEFETIVARTERQEIVYSTDDEEWLGDFAY